MTPLERRASISLAVIYNLRMLGLFMIFPVFSLHADRYAGATPMLTGLALAIYGLTQALFQVPFGLLSDRLGRKRVIAAGLVLFAAGSVVAALADSIFAVIAGRALQGLGAIAAAVMALTADLTREEQRTKAMAIIGASIGLAFGAAMVLGPAVTAAVGIDGLFWVTAALAAGGIVVLHRLVPEPVAARFHRDAEPLPGQFSRVLGDPELLRLDAGILFLHLVMTANFVVLPLALRDEAGLAPAHHWMVYLGVLVASLGIMIPAIALGERRRRHRELVLGAVAVLLAAQAGLAAAGGSLGALVLALVVYFGAFNVLEATLPSLVSRRAPADLKGTALGAYSTSQYLGAFLGGVFGGWLHGRFGTGAVFVGCGAVLLGWLAIAAGMSAPPAVRTRIVRLGPLGEHAAAGLESRLGALAGVREAVIVPAEGVAYLKVDPDAVDEAALEAALATPER